MADRRGQLAGMAGGDERRLRKSDTFAPHARADFATGGIVCILEETIWPRLFVRVSR